MHKKVTVKIKTLSIAAVKAKLTAIESLFPDAMEVQIKYCGWAITCDRHKDTIFADSGILVDAGKLGTKRFLARVDGENTFCVPSLDYGKDIPCWYITFTTGEYLDVR